MVDIFWALLLVYTHEEYQLLSSLELILIVWDGIDWYDY